MQNNHIRTAWILSLVYCSKFYYTLMKQYEKHGKPKWERAFFAYGNLQTSKRHILKISLQDLSSKCGIQNTMFWIWDR